MYLTFEGYGFYELGSTVVSFVEGVVMGASLSYHLVHKLGHIIEVPYFYSTIIVLECTYSNMVCEVVSISTTGPIIVDEVEEEEVIVVDDRNELDMFSIYQARPTRITPLRNILNRFHNS